ncbi:winged helix-turn-helix domain-containing protein [Klebsiella aerogenes]|uniref:winged helix-turn-helix domain-containing protein n=1 Tax=Klebsiella aerogenes TaxID=548 RepID=UPI0013DDD6BE|nr:winged helix-turn-helix domain-containing protein [Klebsiella aerogenes]HBY1220626.1 winged helix-turn-helix domain-containing protein [Klebsiella aerogenes]HBY9708569.1 winged helix-turn-helix domain-containing protein [Klebsiella aerogenes]
MIRKYTINNHVVFDVMTRTLTRISAPPENQESAGIILHSPTSECLELLIKNFGGVLSQDKILDSVWLEKGVIVSSAAVYQNISLLRRAFEQLGLEKNIIITKPRQGIMLALDTSIVPLSSSPEDISPEAIQDDSVDTDKRIPEQNGFAHRYLMSGMMLILLLLLATHYVNSASNYMDSYELWPESPPGCKVYVNDGFPEVNISRLVKVDKLDCASYPYQYVTAYPGGNRHSVISCKKDISEVSPRCVSEFYLEG